MVLNPSHRAGLVAGAVLQQRCTPTVHHTTPESPGGEQARAAARAGAKLVVVVGGDGTVREVAGALAGLGQSAPTLGIVPTGTANLFARNLHLPVRQVDAAVSLALGRTAGALPRPVDVGHAAWRTSDGSTHEGWFTVVVGIGNDARTIELVRPAVKKVAGWAAYFEPAVRTMLHRPHPLVTAVDGGTPESFDAWSVLVGNAGRIPMGIKVFPDAEPDDGLLHVLRVRPRNVGSWAVIAAKGALGRHREATGLGYTEAHRLTIDSAAPLPIHLDGDYYRDVVHLAITLHPAAFRIHRPRRKSI